MRGRGAGSTHRRRAGGPGGRPGGALQGGRGAVPQRGLREGARARRARARRRAEGSQAEGAGGQGGGEAGRHAVRQGEEAAAHPARVQGDG